MSDLDRKPRVPPAGESAAASDRAATGRPCPACGDSRRVASGKRSDPGGEGLVRCAACSLVFVDPVPSEAIGVEAYDGSYYEPWQAELEAKARAALWARRLQRLETRQPRGSLLDVGCGDGLFLQVARDAGWAADGIEFSPEGSRRAAARLGRPVAVGDLARSSGLRGPFDVVTLWHVLEHLTSPAPMLRAARQRLRPGGLLVVAVPNLDNLPMRAAYRLARGRPLPLYEAGMREPHLSHFSPATLGALLAREGFERVTIEADRCALTLPKRVIDALAALLSALTGRLLTDAMVAWARSSG